MWVGYYGSGMAFHSLAYTLVTFVLFTVLGFFGHMIVFSDLQEECKPNKKTVSD